ncbi:hypothetical protein [Klebsiella pneumoniae]|uniref:hypothetical protein n=1 Tax=Klebsiella pneumoniae TaxID=573 RepID=UPI003CF9D50C
MNKYNVDYAAWRNRQVIYEGVLTIELPDDVTATDDVIAEQVHATLAERAAQYGGSSPDMVNVNSFEKIE